VIYLTRSYRRFYVFSLAVLLALSAYPVFNGARMAFLGITDGAVSPEAYAKYVVPYAAICLSVILFAVFQPLLFRTGRFAFPAGLAGACGIFIAAEQFFEHIRIATAGMSLVDPASLSAGRAPVLPSAAADAWQASLCIASPLTRGQTVAYASQGRYFYVMANSTYKVHYYLIALLLIAMICRLIYGVGRRLRSGDRTNPKPLVLQGISVSALTALCVFANTTALFRQTAAIQTPLASLLTCLFFVVLGAAVGTYTGSFLLGKGKGLALSLPVLSSAAAVTLMYAGEAVMMKGGLYRFGTGWFFAGLPVISLAPADMAVILLACAATGLILRTARVKEHWPGKRTAVTSIALCALIAVSGIIISAAAPAQNAFIAVSRAEDDISGCYTFKECLYMTPLSSFLPFFMPYVYGIGNDTLIVANTESGDLEQFPAQYEKTPVADDEFTSVSDFDLEDFRAPRLSQYKERWLRADCGGRFRLYQLDGEMWLVQYSNGRLWSIYSLRRTDGTALADLERALTLRDAKQGLPPMTLKDVRALSGLGDALTSRDFERFGCKAVDTDFTTMRYDIAGGCVLLVKGGSQDTRLDSARLSKRGYDPDDTALTVDIRLGPQAVAAYLDPLHSLMKLDIEDSRGGTLPRELIYKYDGYAYYLNTTRAGRVFITFDNGDRLPLKQALEERRLLIEDAVGSGLSGVVMEPDDNPLGGLFPILYHRHTFAFDGEAFYPKASFMYVASQDGIIAYFDLEELAGILAYQGRDALSATLRQVLDTDSLTRIGGKAYIKDTELIKAGLTVDIGWELSSHTPVTFGSE
jgi:hypothetical protein